MKSFEEQAKKESPSIKNLLESLECYQDACKTENYKLINVIFRTLKSDTLYIAEKGNAETNFIEKVKNADRTDLPWDTILYLLIDYVPDLKAYYDKVMQRMQ